MSQFAGIICFICLSLFPVYEGYQLYQGPRANAWYYKGTWVCHDQQGFKVIEITDSSDLKYTMMLDRKIYIDTITVDRYYFYKSAGNMSVDANEIITLNTDRFVFNFKMSGDTLVEFDKTGPQSYYFKVKVE